MWRWLKLRTMTGEQTSPGRASQQQTRYAFVLNSVLTVTHWPLWPAKNCMVLPLTIWVILITKKILKFYELLIKTISTACCRYQLISQNPHVLSEFLAWLYFLLPAVTLLFKGCSTPVAQDALMLFVLFPTGCNPKRAEWVQKHRDGSACLK